MFNIRGLSKFLYRSFINNRGTNYRLTLKRLGVLLLALVIYIPAEVLIWSGLILDNFLFRMYREIEIESPVFIIGNPRSGTTFLQRLLAKDHQMFFSMKTWEIFASPSITSRKVLVFLVRIARSIGMSISKRIHRLESLWAEGNRIHRLALRAPEEDEYLFIHIFSALKIWSFAAMTADAAPFIRYDQEMPEREKNRMMDFYQRCLQRHVYFHHGEYKHYLAKNPNFSPMIRTILKRFPGAKFIYLIRDPRDAVSSHLSLKEREWQMLGSPLEPYASREFILDASEYWYNYPLEVVDQLEQNQGMIILFDDLTGNAKKVVEEIYQRFGFELSAEYREILIEETEKARQHESEHNYDTLEMGLSEEQIKSRFNEVYQRFEFPD